RWPRDWSSDVCSSDLSRRDRAVAILNPFISKDDVLSFCFNDSAVDHVLSGTPEEESAKPSLFKFISGPEGGKSISASPESAVMQIGRASCRERGVGGR